MPYIHPELRKDIDGILNSLQSRLENVSEHQIDGVMNYVITKLIHRQYRYPSYKAYNSAVGVLESAKLELYRRKVAPYEDKKIQENGDV
jgi:hypothetical protein